MNARLVLQRLWWKELRQLMPMVILLPLLSLLLLIFYLINRGQTVEAFTAPVILLLGMPGLFAVGAGALLVGQEKELRTLEWLTSLPIAPHRIVRVKLAAGLVGLLVLWLLSWLFFTTAWAMDFRLTATGIQWMSWPLNSLFVLLAGFALAWWANSALVAILLVVPVATVPFLLASAIDTMAPWRDSVLDKPSVSTLMVCQLLLSGVALWAADRLGLQALAPRSPARTVVNSWLPALDRYRSTAQRAGYGKVQAPWPALLWQFVCQSRVLLCGTSIMLGVSALLILTTGLTQRQGIGMPFAILLAFLATSWLGVGVFQSDAVHERIRFLADRGISPRSIWMTRQAPPVSILVLFVFSVVLIGLLSRQLLWQNLPSAVTAVALYALALAVVYLFTHWTGQVISSPIVSTVAAPFVALGAIGYASFSLTSLGTPWWLALLVLLIPLAATLTMARRWMDRRFSVSYWASHAGFLAAVLFLPAVPLLLAVVRQPAMPPHVAREIDAVAVKSQAYLVKPHELVLGAEEQGPQRELGADRRQSAAFQPMVVRWQRQLNQIENQLRETSGPISVSSMRVIQQLRTIATLTRLSLDRDPGVGQDSAVGNESGDRGDESAEQPSALQLYQKSIDLLVQITVRMRLSPRLIEQDAADLLELSLLSEMTHEPTRGRLGETLYRAAAAVLADRSGRNAARLRAVALSWDRFQYDLRTSRNPPTSLGGYDLHDTQVGAGTLKGSLISKRRIGLATADLWALAKGGEEAATQERLGRIARYWGRPPGDYGIGPVGIHRRADDLDRFAHPGFQFMRGAVAGQWFAHWERQAAQWFQE